MKKELFIDKEEISEILCEYYDFRKVTDEQWSKIDEEIKSALEERNIDYRDMNDSEYETFCAIADGACSRNGVLAY